jgi:hypothetical protein
MHLSNHLFSENKKSFLILIVLFLIILVAGETVHAQVPNTLNYQGVLTGSNGKPVTDGQYQLTFKLYDQATGGTATWSETQNTTTTNGVFTVLLGKVTSLTDVPFDKPYWLGITVGNGSEMTPRVPLSTSAYSLATRSLEDSVKVYDLDISKLLWATVGSSSSGYLSLKIDAPNVLTSDVINNWVVLVYVESTDFGYWALVPYYTERDIRVTADVEPGYVILKRDQDGQPITQSNFSALRLVLINPVTFGAIN